MKTIIGKANIAKLFTLGLTVGALALAAPHKADAQVGFGVRVGPVVVHGGPVYGRPYYAPRYYAPVPVYGYGYRAPAYAYGGGGYYGHPYFDRFHHEGWYGRR